MRVSWPPSAHSVMTAYGMAPPSGVRVGVGPPNARGAGARVTLDDEPAVAASPGGMRRDRDGTRDMGVPPPVAKGPAPAPEGRVPGPGAWAGARAGAPALGARYAPM